MAQGRENRLGLRLARRMTLPAYPLLHLLSTKPATDTAGNAHDGSTVKASAFSESASIFGLDRYLGACWPMVRRLASDCSSPNYRRNAAF